MRIRLEGLDAPPFDDPRVGNVYPIKGGRGLSRGHMNVLFAITEGDQWQGPRALMLTINKEGYPVGVTHYAMHYVENLQPMAFVEGLEGLEFNMRSL